MFESEIFKPFKCFLLMANSDLLKDQSIADTRYLHLEIILTFILFLKCSFLGFICIILCILQAQIKVDVLGLLKSFFFQF